MATDKKARMMSANPVQAAGLGGKENGSPDFDGRKGRQKCGGDRGRRR